MPRYTVLYKANPAAWPTAPQQILAAWEQVMAAGDQLFKMGQLKEVGWFTGSEGYAIFEAASKDQVLGFVNPFFPYYSQEVHEIVPWDRVKEALLASARMVAGKP